MLETDRDEAPGSDPLPRETAPEPPETDRENPSPSSTSAPDYDESILEELGAVIDDAKLYATAELAFQKTRAKILGKATAIAAGAIILALILLHIAIIALAVGLVIALEPLATIWGAIAIVVGVMLLGVALLGYLAMSKGRLISEMFASAPAQSSDQETEK